MLNPVPLTPEIEIPEPEPLPLIAADTTWHVPGDYATLAAALDAARGKIPLPGVRLTIEMGAGVHDVASAYVLDAAFLPWVDIVGAAYTDTPSGGFDGVVSATGGSGAWDVTYSFADLAPGAISVGDFVALLFPRQGTLAVNAHHGLWEVMAVSPGTPGTVTLRNTATGTLSDADVLHSLAFLRKFPTRVRCADCGWLDLRNGSKLGMLRNIAAHFVGTATGVSGIALSGGSECRSDPAEFALGFNGFPGDQLALSGGSQWRGRVIVSGGGRISVKHSRFNGGAIATGNIFGEGIYVSGGTFESDGEFDSVLTAGNALGIIADTLGTVDAKSALFGGNMMGDVIASRQSRIEVPGAGVSGAVATPAFNTLGNDNSFIGG
jgi:hypothetical protein